MVTVVDTINFTASTTTLGCTVTDQYGNLLNARIAPVETVVASNPSIYTATIPNFDQARSGFFVWDNSGKVLAKHSFSGPEITSHRSAPFYNPQFPAVKH
jgi:hypothetical protein